MRRVVITGIGVVTPNAKSFDEFSESLQIGESGLSQIDYFDASCFPSRIVGQVKNLNIAHLKERFPALETINDQKVFIGLCAFLQLIDSHKTLLKTCPVHLGSSLEMFLIQKLFTLSPYSFNIDTYMDALKDKFKKPYIEAPLDFLGNFIKSEFSIKGPSYLNCSACTASTQAIGHSFHMIRDGRYDQVIAGGFDSMLNPLGLGGFSRLGALCTDNELKEKAIRPFDMRRQGTILGEGAAIFILEEHEHALKNKKTILAEIVGYASTFDAFKLSEPERSGEGIAAAIKSALSDSCVDSEKIDYINAHGTGTIANDKVETKAIKKVFGNRAYSIPISSTKSMIGHLVGASGAVETAAIIAMIKGEFIAPTINLEKNDPECDLDYVPQEARKAKINFALKNSMGFGGQNAAIILRRYEE